MATKYDPKLTMAENMALANNPRRPAPKPKPKPTTGKSGPRQTTGQKASGLGKAKPSSSGSGPSGPARKSAAPSTKVKARQNKGGPRRS